MQKSKPQQECILSTSHKFIYAILYFVVFCAIGFALFVVAELGFPSQPTTKEAFAAIKEYGGGVDPWDTAAIITVTHVMPRTTIGLVDYRTRQNRCLGLYHMTKRPFSGIHLYQSETACEMNPPPIQTPFSVIVSKDSNQYFLTGFALHKNITMVEALWLDGTVQQSKVKDGIFFFTQASKTNAIISITGLDDMGTQVTDPFSNY